MLLVLSILLIITTINSQSTITNQVPISKDTGFSFTSSFINTFAVIFVSEIADKTFILLLFFSMRTSKLKIFIVSSISLLTMNVLTVLIGYSIPLLLYRSLIDWVALVTFFIFGVYLIHEACTMEHKTLQTKYEKYVRKQETKKQNEIQSMIENNESRQPLNSKDIGVIEPAYRQDNENKILFSFFTSLMLAECGDRSQLATITLGAVYDLYGTLLGTSCAHILCNLIAIYLGSSLAKYLSEKQMNFIGGIIFLFMSLGFLLLKLKIIT